MQIKQDKKSLSIESTHYTLTLAVPPLTSYFFCKNSGRLFGFVAGGDCDLEERNDRMYDSGEWEYQVSDTNSIQLRREETSAVWDRKIFRIQAENDAIEFYHELEGDGRLNEVRYFRHCIHENEYGFAGDIDEIYSVAPNFREQSYYHPAARVILSYGNDLSLNTGCHALASVPHVMGLHDRRDPAYLGAAVFSRPGEYGWDDFIWNPDTKNPPTGYEGDNCFAGGFAIRYAGKKTIRGRWSSPRLVFTFPESAESVLPVALEHAYRKDYLPRPGRHTAPDWWREPIYCPWHDQSALAMTTQVDYHNPQHEAREFCTREWTEHWLEILMNHGIKPGIVILDDKWQKSLISADPDNAGWPDLRRWIDHCHERGIRVFLWYPAWHSQDIPEEEAITRDGKILCGDITHPRHEARIREMIRRYFSSAPDGLNADGIKIDGLLGLPVGRGLKNHADLWGLELQKYLLRVIHEETKKTKPQACVSVYTANPYLDSHIDMVRLADMYTCRLTPVNSMRIRKAVYAATHPGIPVDTDGQFYFHQPPDYIHDLAVEMELGIPTIYNAEYVRRHRLFFHPEYHRLTDNDYEEIRNTFQTYRKQREEAAAAPRWNGNRSNAPKEPILQRAEMEDHSDDSPACSSDSHDGKR